MRVNLYQYLNLSRGTLFDFLHFLVGIVKLYPAMRASLFTLPTLLGVILHDIH